MKKDVYEHLAYTFLDKKKNKKRLRNRRFLIYVGIGGIVFLLGLYIIISRFTTRNNLFSKSLTVLQDKAPLIINYDFTSLGISKIRTLSFNLEGIDLSEYHFIELVVRTQSKTEIDSTVKVQIENMLLEKDSKYMSGINNKWRKFILSFSDFKLISNWTKVKAISFVVEEWNVSNKKDKIFIDDVRFIE